MSPPPDDHHPPRDEEKPPLFRSWKGIYAAVFAYLAVLIALFWLFTKIYS